MNPKFSSIGNPLDRTVEECAELIFEISKAHRFGLFNHNPENGELNADAIIREAQDVRASLDKLDSYIFNMRGKDVKSNKERHLEQRAL